VIPIPIWLQIPIVLGLALAAWISGMDANGSPVETSLLWGAATLAGAHLLIRLLAPSR
jgi:hypothetical protein